MVIKEKIVSWFGSLSGLTSILGSWQVCHNLCLGLITLLSIFGIMIAGMPLLFLTKLAIPFWIVAFLLLSLTFGFYFKKRCISKKVLYFNSGLIIAGIPFNFLQGFTKFFWIIGGSLVLVSAYMFFNERGRSK